MKITSLLKAVGAIALVTGFAPYHFSTDPNTGEKKVRALLWEVTSDSNNDADKNYRVKFGFINPVKNAESQLYADDLTVNYSHKTDKPVETGEAPEAAAESETVSEVSAAEPDAASNEETTIDPSQSAPETDSVPEEPQDKTQTESVSSADDETSTESAPNA